MSVSSSSEHTQSRYNLAKCLVSHCGLSVFQIVFRLCHFVSLSKVSHFARAVCDRDERQGHHTRHSGSPSVSVIQYEYVVKLLVVCRCGPSCRALCRRWRRCACNEEERTMMLNRGRLTVLISAESIPTLKNRESIHFGFLLRGFVEKESINDT